jgi:hypothetical protein
MRRVATEFLALRWHFHAQNAAASRLYDAHAGLIVSIGKALDFGFGRVPDASYKTPEPSPSNACRTIAIGGNP